MLAKFANFEELLKVYYELGAVFSTPAITNDYLVFTCGGWIAVLFGTIEYSLLTKQQILAN